MLVEFDRVELVRGASKILQDVSVRIEQPRVGIIGPNGAGKSSFARLINGLLVPTAGRVLFNGLDVQQNVRQVRREIGFLFQDPDNQIVFPVVREDMDFGLKALIPDRALRSQRILETLDRIGILDLVDRPVHTLSGGQKQLVALATVLACRPALLVLDEPTTALDLRYRNIFRSILNELDVSVILLTHDLGMLESFDRVLVIANGTVVFDSEPDLAIAWYVEHYG